MRVTSEKRSATTKNQESILTTSPSAGFLCWFLVAVEYISTLVLQISKKIVINQVLRMRMILILKYQSLAVDLVIATFIGIYDFSRIWAIF